MSSDRAWSTESMSEPVAPLASHTSLATRMAATAHATMRRGRTSVWSSMPRRLATTGASASSMAA